MTRLLMTTDAIGGVWQYSTELARALKPLGVDTVLAVMGPTTTCHPGPFGEAQDRLEPGSRYLSTPEEAGSRIKSGMTEEVEVIHTTLPLDWLAPGPAEVAAAGDAIAALAAEVNADLVHLNSPALAARTRFPVPVVAVAHGCLASWWQGARGTAPTPDHAWHAELMAAGLLAADATAAPSAAFAATLQHLYHLPTPPLVVHNGRSAPAASDVAPARGAFTAGRLWDAVKNTPLLDEVAALIDAPFRAAGPLVGPHGEAVALRHLDHLGTLADEEVAAALAGRPIYVSAARFEPFGLSVLEAAAAGCPLVLSGIDTFRELWTGAALLVPDETPEAYAAAIRRIADDPALRAHLGDAARVRAARYTPAAMAAAMAAIYAGILSQPQQVAA